MQEMFAQNLAIKCAKCRNEMIKIVSRKEQGIKKEIIQVCRKERKVGKKVCK